MKGTAKSSLQNKRFQKEGEREMRRKWYVLGLLIALSTLIFSGCAVSLADEANVEPNPAPENVPDPKAARDAVLAYIREHYGRSAPAEGIVWAEENITPEEWVGATTLRYSGEDWAVTITYPIVNPASTTYDVEVTGKVLGFQWKGKVDASGQVTEVRDEAVEWLSPVGARDAALDYVSDRYDPALVGLTWTEQNLTEEGLVGGSALPS
jgi:hypothetical protein